MVQQYWMQQLVKIKTPTMSGFFNAPATICLAKISVTNFARQYYKQKTPQRTPIAVGYISTYKKEQSKK